MNNSLKIILIVLAVILLLESISKRNEGYSNPKKNNILRRRRRKRRKRKCKRTGGSWDKGKCKRRKRKRKRKCLRSGDTWENGRCVRKNIHEDDKIPINQKVIIMTNQDHDHDDVDSKKTMSQLDHDHEDVNKITCPSFKDKNNCESSNMSCKWFEHKNSEHISKGLNKDFCYEDTGVETSKTKELCFQRNGYWCDSTGVVGKVCMDNNSAVGTENCKNKQDEEKDKTTNEKTISAQEKEINNQFKQFKKSISDEMCQCEGKIFPENSACKYNFNKCVDACYPSIQTKIKLLTELKPLKECKDKISSDEIKTKLQSIGQCSSHLRKIQSLKEDKKMPDVIREIGNIANNCGEHSNYIKQNITKPQDIKQYLGGKLIEIIDETKKNEGSPGCTESHINGLKKDVTDIPGYFLTEYRKIGKKYIEETSDSCKNKRGKEGAIIAYDENLNEEGEKINPSINKDCCNTFYDCHDFMRMELSNKKEEHTTVCNSPNECVNQVINKNNPSTSSNSFQIFKVCPAEIKEREIAQSKKS